MKALINGQIVTSNKIIKNGYLIYNKKIVAIGQGELPDNSYLSVIDCDNNLIIPGMIDIHVHGNSGVDVMDSGTNSLVRIAGYIAKQGVTSFLPTTMTRPWLEIENALQSINLSSKRELRSRILGAHLEGPFISIAKKGAQLAENILKPRLSILEKYIETIKIITYAPETDLNLNFTQATIKKYPRLVLSAGHTNASYEQACKAIKMGLKSATHIFNGMTALHHRSPGIVAAILEKDTYCELIADDVHVHPAWYRILLRVKGADKLILVSDAMKATGCDDGVYIFGGQQVEVKNRVARLAEGGSLAGSTLNLNRAAYNFTRHTNCSIINIVKMVSYNPAKLLGIDDKFGSLEVGKTADLVICDTDFKVSKTILEGHTVYK